MPRKPYFIILEDRGEQPPICYGGGFWSKKVYPARPATRLEVDWAKRWVKEFMKPRKTINYDHGSYRFKHWFENWVQELPVEERPDWYYMPNGAMIQAFHECGYDVARGGNNDNDGYFNVSIPKWGSPERRACGFKDMSSWLRSEGYSENGGFLD